MKLEHERFALSRRPGADRLTAAELAVFCECHPELVERLVRLGVLEEVDYAGGEPVFDSRSVDRLARGLRLHADLGVSFAALGLVLDLLERIDSLEDAVRRMR